MPVEGGTCRNAWVSKASERYTLATPGNMFGTMMCHTVCNKRRDWCCSREVADRSLESVIEPHTCQVTGVVGQGLKDFHCYNVSTSQWTQRQPDSVILLKWHS